jgi:large subunit ribosomal protein L30
MSAQERLLVRQLRGEAGRPWQQRLVLKGLGLRGPGSEVLVQNERAIRGMIRKVLHLVEVEAATVPAGKAVAGKAATAPAAKAPVAKAAPKQAAGAKAPAAKKDKS